MWHDNETSTDLLGFDYLSAALVEVLTEPRLLPVTVGVFGDWGSGKSSLMKIATADLQGREKTATIEFSAWQFEGYEDVKAALMQVIMRRLEQEQGLSEKAAGLRDRLLKRVDWFYVMGLAASRIATLTPPTLEDLQRAVKPSEGEEQTQAIQDFRDDFAALLSEIENIDVLAVFIDDLDRCLPTTIIETFEAIRLFLAVPKTAFVIAADERIIRYAIRSRYPAEAGVDLGRDYLEKIVQVPIRVPPLTDAEVETYLNLLSAELAFDDEAFARLRERASEARASDALAVACNYGIARSVVDPIPEQLQADFDLVARIAPVLAAGLHGNPRQLKRFMNALVLRRRAAAARSVDLDAAVLAKLMILEYLHEVQFRTLFEWQAASHGQPPALAEAERSVSQAEDPKLSEALPFVTEPSLRTWIALDPPLAEVDLQPYFYFSRDRIEMTAPGRRLPRELQELFGHLTSASDAYRAQALVKAAELPDSELRALYEALVDRFVRIPSMAKLDDSLIELAAARAELVQMLLVTLGEVPPLSLDPGVPLRLAAKIGAADIRALLESWAGQGEAGRLATAARLALSRLEKAEE
jgi:hypothetical protein